MRSVRPMVILGCALGLAFGYWHTGDRTAPKPAHVVIVHDRSKSAGEGCDSVLGLAARAFQLTRETGGISSIAVFATANSPGDELPLMVQDHFSGAERWDLPYPRKEELFKSIERACANFRPADHSPLLAALGRGIKHLRDAGCGEDSNCYLLFQTDGRETVQQEMVRLLKDSPGAKVTVTGLIRNAGIHVFVCGLGNTARPVDMEHEVGERTERVREVWIALFTHPERVTIEVACPKVFDDPRDPRRPRSN